jgi:5-carboxymethyl-2-hydroxymuconate isomerase
MFESLLVQRQLTCLSKRLSTAGVVANKRFLVEVDVHMLFQILAQRKFLRTKRTGKSTFLHVRGQVTPQGKARSVLLIAIFELTNVGSLLSHHRFCVQIIIVSNR